VPDRTEPPASEEAGDNDGARFDGGRLQQFCHSERSEESLGGFDSRQKTTERFLASLEMTKRLSIAVKLN
jgi:hypothetical protein